MKLIIANDPIYLLLSLVKKKYPKIKTEIWMHKMKTSGITFFKKNHIPIIKINYNIPYYAVTEVLAH